ncbi:MAG: hypothetical protein WC390_09120 [Sulfurimonas sp.]|jgi:hypothetical protein
MNSKKAKKLRKDIYGDMSLKENRTYYQSDNGGKRVGGLRGDYRKEKHNILLTNRSKSYTKPLRKNQ